MRGVDCTRTTTFAAFGEVARSRAVRCVHPYLLYRTGRKPTKFYLYNTFLVVI